MKKKKSWLYELGKETTRVDEFHRYQIADELMESCGYDTFSLQNRELRDAIGTRNDSEYCPGKNFNKYDIKINETILKMMEQNPKLTRKIYRQQVNAANYRLKEIFNWIYCWWENFTDGVHMVINSEAGIISSVITIILMAFYSFGKCNIKIGKILFGHFIGSRILAKKIIDMDIDDLKSAIKREQDIIKEEEKQAVLAREEELKGTTRIAQEIGNLLGKIQTNANCDLSTEISRLRDLYIKYRTTIAQDGKYVNEAAFLTQIAQIEFDVDKKIVEYNYKKQTIIANDRYLNNLAGISNDLYDENIDELANQNTDEKKLHLSL